MIPLDLYHSRFEPGIHLVEASAGTGKTYSIAQLVVRFVVEEGISVEEMGVVTFTRAATAELRQRIRQRLLEVRGALAGGDVRDFHLAEWIGVLSDHEAARRRLSAELLKLELMPIQTIHSFCQYALRQQALEAGELLGQTMLEEDGPFLQAIVDDFWRCQELKPWQWRRVLECTPTPDALAKVLQNLRPPLRFVPEASGEESLDLNLEDRQWEAFAAWMDGLCAQGWFNQKACAWWHRLRREHLPARLKEIKIPFDFLTFLETELNGRKLRSKSLCQLPDYPCHRPLLEALQELGRRQAQFEIAWLQKAWRHFQKELELRLRRDGLLTHDFVVRRLAKVVEQVPMTALKQRFRVFFIDEFQDTDSHQWRIFSQLCGGSGRFLFLIGDPKQSIYRFRGADLDTYFEAARAAHRRWWLDTNYRSHPELVAAVNSLFQEGDAFLQPELRFAPVHPGCGREEAELRRGGQAVPPFRWQAFEAEGAPYRYRTKGEAIERLARHVAGDLIALLNECRLLTKSEQEETVFQERPLRSGDIAILVRGNDTAITVREVLREYRLPAVLIDRRSVYETDTAQKLHRLLMALWEGPDWKRVKRVLADGWFGVDGRGLAAVEESDEVGRYLEAFLEAAERWRSDSLLVALEGLFRCFGVWGHIAAQRYGTRTLADLRHLLEMLQAEAARHHLGPQALLTWYRRRLASPAGEAEQLRLESDEDAVKLVTMHSAKGLEYPVVLCFDLWLPQEVKKTDPIVVGEEVVFQAAGEAFERAFTARVLAERQEAMRLAYVALTRAKAHCCVYVLEKRQTPPPWSPLRHLLVRAADDDLFLAAQRLARTHPQIFSYRRRPWSDLSHQPWHLTHPVPSLQVPPPLYRDLKREVQVLASYSSLVRGRSKASPSDWIERLLEEGMADPDGSLPRGAAFGNLLHALLEQVPFADLARRRLDPRLWEQCRRQAGFGEDLELEAVLPLLERAVTTKLPEFTLAQVDPRRQLHELEFFLPVRSLTAASLNALLGGQPWFRPLAFAEIKGFLRGFIDLVVEHQGRFYVIDYKSNELDAYDPAHLTLAMREHDYGLQAVLYALALHRYLKVRLKGYDYPTHFGGIRYLFLRGMAEGQGVFGFRPEPAWIEELEAQLG